MMIISSMPSLICDSPAVNGEKLARRYEGAYSATSAIGEIIEESVPLPVYGERMPAGR
jgi:hypothetical protein